MADFYETDYVDRVEVLRGSGSILYRSNAMGGVIHVITKEADRDGVHTTLTSRYGSYYIWRSSLVNMARLRKLSSLVSLTYARTVGLEDNFDCKQGSLYAKVGYITGLPSLELFAVFNNLTNTDYVINRGDTMPEFNGMGGFKWHF